MAPLVVIACPKGLRPMHRPPCGDLEIRAQLRDGLAQSRICIVTRVAKIIRSHIADLITVTTTGPGRHSKPSIHWQRHHDAITTAAHMDGLYALAANLPDPPDHELTALDVSPSTKTSGSWNNATAI
jgi:hypothetical protein